MRATEYLRVHVLLGAGLQKVYKYPLSRGQALIYLLVNGWLQIVYN